MMRELTELTVAEIRDGVAAGELHRAWKWPRRSTPMSPRRSPRSTRSSSPRPKRRSTPRRPRSMPTAPRASRWASWRGVPIGMKDLFATSGVQTTAASHILEGFVPEYESTVSQKLWDAGAGMLGKLNLDQFAMGSSNETSYFGNVISPWRRKDGGHRRRSRRAVHRAAARRRSRRGCARRRPAPTPAARSASPPRSPASPGSSRPMAAARAGASSPSPPRSTRPGPMARTVRDCAIMLEAMAGFDPKDATSLDLPVPDVGSRPVGRSHRQAHRHPARIPHGRDGRRRREIVGRRHRLAQGRGRHGGRHQPAAHEIRAAHVLHHRPCRSLVQPRAL